MCARASTLTEPHLLADTQHGAGGRLALPVRGHLHAGLLRHTCVQEGGGQNNFEAVFLFLESTNDDCVIARSMTYGRWGTAEQRPRQRQSTPGRGKPSRTSVEQGRTVKEGPSQKMTLLLQCRTLFPPDWNARWSNSGGCTRKRPWAGNC